MILGYARVSTKDQSLKRQIDVLESTECKEVYKEKISGRRKDKPELERLVFVIHEVMLVFLK